MLAGCLTKCMNRIVLGFVVVIIFCCCCCLFLFLKMLTGCSTKCLNRIVLGFVVVEKVVTLLVFKFNPLHLQKNESVKIYNFLQSLTLSKL